MAFTHDPNTDEGKMRSLCNDTDSTNFVFSDAELTNILDLNSSDVWLATADCCRALAAKYAKEAFILGLGKQDIYLDRKGKADYYLKLAQTYSNRSSSDVVEYMDHYNINVSAIGNDESEYIGDN